MPTNLSVVSPYPSQRVVVMRHGERRDSASGTPAESNPPLTAAGVAAIQSVAARLKGHLGADAAYRAVLIVSPFLRTLQTAEALQHHGVGAARAMVIDNTLSEVFGPCRIKTQRAPQLQVPPLSHVVGALPSWGESIEKATKRFVANFLRNGDVYGGYLTATSFPTDASLSGKDGLPSSQSPVLESVPRLNKGRLPPRNLPPGALVSRNTRNLSNMVDDQPCDVILITHGDAISAVVSHFYPSRVVYEAEFLSYVIMRRHGVGNRVYHLEKSVGVNWLVEGIDAEPQDPILFNLEKQRLVAESGSGAGYDNDNGGDRLEDGADVPINLAGSRMQPRHVGGIPDHSHANRGVQFTARSNAEASSPAEVVNMHNPTTHSRTTRGAANNRDLRGSSFPLATHAPMPLQVPEQSPPPTHQHHHQPSNALQDPPYNNPLTATTDAAVASAFPQSPYRHPNAGEGCERIRLPTGTPAQSSSNSVSNYGHSSGECAEDTEAAGNGSSSPQQRERERPLKGAESVSNLCYSTEERETEKGIMLDESNHVPIVPLLSDYRGLSEEPSIGLWARPPSMPATFLSAATTTRIDESRPLPHLETTSAVATAGVLVSYGSDAAAPADKSFETDCAEDGTVVRGGASLMILPHPTFSTAVAVGASGDSADALNRRIDRQQSVIYDSFVSFALRAAAVFLILFNVLVQRHDTATLWFGAFALTWEMGFAVVLYCSCQPSGWRMRRIRSAVEQLHFSVPSARGRATTARRQCVVMCDADSPDGASDDSSKVQPLCGFGRSSAGAAVSINSVESSGGSDSVGRDALAPNGILKRAVLSVLCGIRLVVATVLKLVIISVLSFVFAFLCGSPAPGVMSVICNIYESTVGLVLLLTYGCVCVVRGLWDERRLDGVIDRV
ncbi:Histidine phosphatase superfamily (branch 1), putative [Leishmania guyanensis]|uniref:Uncharacterized protein n=1 Tax=Leishmania guyanensis TaxID=5670 RepID=A0A1E1J6D0_LEIGU|nr:hypothetical protein, conserved [Leishmania guyanensis]